MTALSDFIISFIYSIAKILFGDEINLLISSDLKNSDNALALAVGNESPHVRAFFRCFLYSSGSLTSVIAIFFSIWISAFSHPKEMKDAFNALSVATAPAAKISALETA